MPSKSNGANRAKEAEAIVQLQRALATFASSCRQLEEMGFSNEEIDGMPISEGIAKSLRSAYEQSQQPAEPPASPPPPVALTSIEELPMWFDVLRDLAVMASCERMPRQGTLLWSIEKLSEKFRDDAQQIVSAQLETGVDHE